MAPLDSNPVRRRVLAFLIPDASLALALVTLFYCLFLFDGWHALFRDSDTGWHIRTGELILDTHMLPATDTYSFTRSGEPWLDWEWASDVLSASAHKLAGLSGVAALFAVAIATCTYLWMRLTFAVNGDLLVSFLFASPMLTTANLHWLARPHVFGWILLLAVLILLERRAPLTIFLIAGALWANLHGSFFLGPVIAALYTLGRVIAPRIWTAAAPAGTARHSALAAVALAAGTLLNPYGWNLHRHVAAYLADADLLDRIGEFQSFNFHAPGAVQIVLTLAIAIAGAVCTLSNRRLDHFLTATLFIAIALRSARGLPIVALAVLPLANAGITAALRQAQALAPGVHNAIHTAIAYSARLRDIDRTLAGYALIPVILLFTYVIARGTQAGFPADQFPVAAATAAVDALPYNSRILAPDKFGGYLIYRFLGARKVFFDGRSDFYGAAFMKDYIRLVEVRPGWTSLLAKHHFTHALLPVDYSLVPALQQLGWSQVHHDSTAVLLAAPVN